MRRPWSGGAFVSRLGSRLASVLALLFLMAGLAAGAAASGGESRGVPPEDIYQPRDLVPVDSATPLRVGDVAPDFDLPGIVPGSEPGIDGGRVRLSDYRGRKNVLVSFVPAAWTPVCSDQWPGYNLARELFEAHDTVVLGVSVDNVPTLYAWTREMGGLWFPVASDFWPHGAAASAFGVLRRDGTAERALFLVDKQGIIRFLDVHDINSRPDLGRVARALDQLP